VDSEVGIRDGRTLHVGTNMKFYRVHAQTSGESYGFEWFTNKREAEKRLREFQHGNDDDSSELHEIAIYPSKTGILRALTMYASHADNG
jgi:hypothetical protein